MHNVFSRQTPSAEYTETDCIGIVLAAGSHDKPSFAVDTETIMCTSHDIRPPSPSQVAALEAGKVGANDVCLQRKSSFCYDAELDVPETDSYRHHRRSCHGTVADDQLKGGIKAVSGSCQNASTVDKQDSKPTRTGNLRLRKSAAMTAQVACKDVSSKRQSDQVQHYSCAQQPGVASRLRTATFSRDSASSWPSTEAYATPFAAPEVQFCTCHVDVRCKQHPRRRMQLAARKIEQFFRCTACFKA